MPFDPTIKYGRELCDIVIENCGDLPGYHARLAAFARACGF